MDVTRESLCNVPEEVHDLGKLLPLRCNCEGVEDGETECLVIGGSVSQEFLDGIARGRFEQRLGPALQELLVLGCRQREMGLLAEHGGLSDSWDNAVQQSEDGLP